MKKASGDKIFDILNYTCMILFCLTIVYPFIQQIIISISPPNEAKEIGLHIFTKSPTFDSYRRVFLLGTIGTAFYWTILRTILGTVLTVIVSTMCAYPLSKKYLFGRKFWMWIVTFTMFFSGGLIPSYLLVKNLHMVNTVWSLVLPGMCSAWILIIIKNFFEAMPIDVEESAKIDGANEIIIFFRIIIPLSMPIIATVVLWTMVGHWNSWFDAIMYITKPKIQVLQVVLRNIILESSMMEGNDANLQIVSAGQRYTSESVKAAVLMVVTIPIVMVYPFLQKYFVKGIFIGSVKG